MELHHPCTYLRDTRSALCLFYNPHSCVQQPGLNTVIKLFIFALFALTIAQVLMRFIRGIQANVSDGASGKTVHIQTPVGTVDLKPNTSLHPALASILVYPGAAPLESQPPEYEADIALLGREFQILVAGYWTATPEDVVWQFYRRELPGWQENNQGGARGRSLMRCEQDCERSVRVYSQNGRTQIENRVTTKQLAGAAAASSSSYGVLR